MNAPAARDHLPSKDELEGNRQELRRVPWQGVVQLAIQSVYRAESNKTTECVCRRRDCESFNRQEHDDEPDHKKESNTASKETNVNLIETTMGY